MRHEVATIQAVHPSPSLRGCCRNLAATKCCGPETMFLSVVYRPTDPSLQCGLAVWGNFFGLSAWKASLGMFRRHLLLVATLHMKLT